MKGTDFVQENNLFDANTYPVLHQSTHLLELNPNPLIGMDDTLKSILAGLYKDEMSNILLLAEAGNGKTATVQEFAKRYNDKFIVLQTSIAQMQAGGVEYLAKNFKELFFELGQYRKNQREKRQLVLFIDELHQLPMASKAAVEDLKPEFARSAQLGIHIIGATTYDEYREYIEDNAALMQRFEVINLPIVDDELTFKILKSRMRKQHDLKQTPDTDKILREIIYYTDTYIKARVQPRKSTDILDQMIGWVRIGEKFDHKLLAKVLYVNTHVRVDLQLDARGLKDYLNSRVYNQPLAVDAIVNNAYSAILGVTDDHKPRGAFLFVGSTGVGKTELAKSFTTGVFGQDARMVTFDMAEYHNDDTIELFQRRLTDVVLSANTPVILLDEIEKANRGISMLLFSVLDEARLSDRNGREVNFSNIFFLFTTNAGSDMFDDIAGQGLTDEESTAKLEKYNRLIFRNLANDKSFPTPLLGRMTGFIPFNPMNDATNKKIARRSLHRVAKMFMQKQNVKVRYDEANIIRFITEEKLDQNAEAGGARQITTLVRRNIINEISQYLIFHSNVTDVYVTTAGLARTQSRTRLASTEHVIVNETSADIVESDYKFALTKFKTPLVKRLKYYQKMGFKMDIDSKALFMALSRTDLNEDIDDTLDRFFEPFEEYKREIMDWQHKYAHQPRNINDPCPSLKIKLTTSNNELEIKPL